jgi:hypothetical protein
MTKRTLLLVLPALALVAAGLAVAKVVSVQLTPTGPQPATVTVDWGDTVALVNGSGGPQLVDIPRAGITGETVAPGETLEFPAVGRAGNYNFSQAGSGGRFAGRITVQVTGEVTLAAKPETVVYGGRTTFTGRSTVPNSAVAIQRFTGDEETPWVDVAEATPDAEGAFTAATKPEVGARYRATAAAGQAASRPLSVAVAPRLRIRVSDKSVPAGTRIAVTGIVTPAGSVRVLDLEVYDGARRRWNRLDSKRMRGAARATFRLRVSEGRARVRVSVRRTGLGPGFTVGASRFIVVTGS